MTDVCRTTYNGVMVRTQVYFTDEHRDGLFRWAKEDRRRFSEVLREIVGKALVERYDRPRKFNRTAWTGFVGAGRSKDKHVAENIDKILYVDPYK